jgi:hypothetical protein
VSVFLKAAPQTRTVALPNGDEATVRGLTTAEALQVKLLAGRGELLEAFFLMAAYGIDGLSESDIPDLKERGDEEALTAAVAVIRELSGLGETAVEDSAKN